MTPQARRAVSIGVTTTVLGALALAALTAARDSVVSRNEYNLHAQAVDNWQANHVQADSAWRREVYAEQRATRELTLEVLCEVKPDARACR